MNRQRFIAVMIAALLAISGALYLSTQRNLPRDPHGLALLLALPVNRDGSCGEQWTVAERAD